MRLTPRIQRALECAADLHRDQFRKGREKLPVLTHLVSVAVLVSEYTDDEEVIMAALLHDTVEDVHGYEYADLRAAWGDRIHDLVHAVSKDGSLIDPRGRQGTWDLQAADYLANLKKGPREACYISCADKWHNLDSMIHEMSFGEAENFVKSFGDMGHRFQWYEDIYTLAKERIGGELPERMRQHAMEFRQLVEAAQ